MFVFTISHFKATNSESTAFDNETLRQSITEIQLSYELNGIEIRIIKNITAPNLSEISLYYHEISSVYLYKKGEYNFKSIMMFFQYLNKYIEEHLLRRFIANLQKYFINEEKINYDNCVQIIKDIKDRNSDTSMFLQDMLNVIIAISVIKSNYLNQDIKITAIKLNNDKLKIQTIHKIKMYTYQGKNNTIEQTFVLYAKYICNYKDKHFNIESKLCIEDLYSEIEISTKLTVADLYNIMRIANEYINSFVIDKNLLEQVTAVMNDIINLNNTDLIEDLFKEIEQQKNDYFISKLINIVNEEVVHSLLIHVINAIKTQYINLKILLNYIEQTMLKSSIIGNS